MASFPKPQIGWRWKRFRPKYRLSCTPVPLIALVNVGLVIALFMVWGSRLVLQPGVLVQLPVAGFVAGAPYGSQVVTVTQEGQVFFNDERMTLERLGSALSPAVQKNKDMALTLEADASVSYETIVRVMNVAAAAGVRQVNLATRPSFGEEVMP